MAGGFFAKLQDGLTKTKEGVVKGINNVLSNFSSVDEDFYEELEETLIMGDIGINATSRIMDKLREQVRDRHITDTAECKELLIENIREQMRTKENAYEFENQKTVIFVIGVNGVGKTTSVGKLAAHFRKKGKKVLVAAADTYRAGATEQLREWTNRAEVPLVAGKEGADPASVIYDAVSSFRSKDIDILMIDTAGRLHNKKNLMEELSKMNRILDKELPGVRRENFIVLDGTTGQNAISQAREFGEVADLTGIVLTKLDGTAKGGIAVAIVSELNIPVKYIGVGEGLDDLERFESDQFVDALFS
ncbi:MULTISPECIES: signal recognition particle-docking protein FtsY [unclassified Butyrivibrio]|jgi:fused signal recognition particle receptor|uniref:signal recognition particle-docking protein FtsY n=1 Tax=unclassified Butyrivibrio TaxID=2639466 RepID=UPI00041229BA|nr:MULTISPECIES: signal recognition particle-docking protein FtsY [unclassified Butyrivibrio]